MAYFTPTVTAPCACHRYQFREAGFLGSSSAREYVLCVQKGLPGCWKLDVGACVKLFVDTEMDRLKSRRESATFAPRHPHPA